jgi:tRNA(Ile)-lysidine synthase TilS/MesJ
MKNSLKIFFLVFIFAAFSCENEENFVAEKMTIEQIKSYTGFEWFEKNYNDFDKYQQSTIDEIAKYFAENRVAENIKLVIFTSPTCECGNSYLKFPYFMKILDSAGIGEDFYEIFVMRNAESSHPYSNSFKINEIPAFAVFKNDKPVYSINDTIIKNNKPTSELDEILLEGLKK